MLLIKEIFTAMWQFEYEDKLLMLDLLVTQTLKPRKIARPVFSEAVLCMKRLIVSSVWVQVTFKVMFILLLPHFDSGYKGKFRNLTS